MAKAEHIIQSVIFDKDLYNITESRKILKHLGLISNGKVDKTYSKQFYRFRQCTPKKNYKYYNHQIMDGVEEIIMYR